MIDISIIIPIFHDKNKIEGTLAALADFFNSEKLSGEIIVVNDGGNDGGAQVVKNKAREFPFIRLIDNPVNRGKGYAVRCGFKEAVGNHIFFTDADLPYLTAPIKTMLSLLSGGTADMTLANRDLSSDEKDLRLPWPRQITHLIYSRVVRLLIPIKFTDTLAGLKGMRREVLKTVIDKLTIDRFSFDVELLLAAQQMGFKIIEVPVSLRNVGKSNLKIRSDAPQMFTDVLKIFLQYRRGFYDKK